MTKALEIIAILLALPRAIKDWLEVIEQSRPR